jgi:hypothetical protein
LRELRDVELKNRPHSFTQCFWIKRKDNIFGKTKKNISAQNGNFSEFQFEDEDELYSRKNSIKKKLEKSLPPGGPSYWGKKKKTPKPRAGQEKDSTTPSSLRGKPTKHL